MSIATEYRRRCRNSMSLFHLSCLFLFLLPYAICFNAGGSIVSPRMKCILLKSRSGQEDPIDETPPPHGTPTNDESGRSRRSVDYPSFAYDVSMRYRSKPVTVKVTPNDNRSQVIRTFIAQRASPRTVSIPEHTPNEVSIVDRIINAYSKLLSNTGFKSELMRVKDTAKRTRMLNERSYARKEPFAAVNITAPPSLADLSPPPSKEEDRRWISTPVRLSSFFIAYFSLPVVTRFLDHFVTMAPEQLDNITSKFGPGISILYGTFVSLTLSILYNRQQEIQDNAAAESALLSMIIRSMLHLFRHDKSMAIEAGQCAADQIRTLVRGSRGGELMLLMYSDPYARMMELIDCREDQLIDQGQLDMGGKAGLISYCREILKDLNKIRASRLSDEALALPPTHFFILTLLTILILLGYVISILPAVDATGAPSNESSLLFGSLCSIYVLFYNFTSDLNNPFQGVYQVRRSSTASHLLEAKWLIANHPLLCGEVDFEEVEEDPNGDLLIRSPGIGDLNFERNDIYPDS